MFQFIKFKTLIDLFNSIENKISNDKIYDDINKKLNALIEEFTEELKINLLMSNTEQKYFLLKQYFYDALPFYVASIRYEADISSENILEPQKSANNINSSIILQEFFSFQVFDTLFSYSRIHEIDYYNILKLLNYQTSIIVKELDDTQRLLEFYNYPIKFIESIYQTQALTDFLDDIFYFSYNVKLKNNDTIQILNILKSYTNMNINNSSEKQLSFLSIYIFPSAVIQSNKISEIQKNHILTLYNDILNKCNQNKVITFIKEEFYKMIEKYQFLKAMNEGNTKNNNLKLSDIITPTSIVLLEKMLEHLGITINGKSSLNEKSKGAIRGIVEAMIENGLMAKVSLENGCNLVAKKIKLELKSKLDETNISKRYKKLAFEYIKKNQS